MCYANTNKLVPPKLFFGHYVDENWAISEFLSFAPDQLFLNISKIFKSSRDSWLLYNPKIIEFCDFRQKLDENWAKSVKSPIFQKCVPRYELGASFTSTSENFKLCTCFRTDEWLVSQFGSFLDDSGALSSLVLESSISHPKV